MRLYGGVVQSKYGKREVLGRPFFVALSKKNTTKGYDSAPYIVTKCECGSIDVVRLSCLRQGGSLMCKQCADAEKVVHGMKPFGKKVPKVYKAWTEMKQRAFNRYGLKVTYSNVDIDPRWDASDGFQAFYEDMGDPPSPKHSLDRIDNTKGYWPWNCRWATIKEQNRNKRNNKMITYEGETKCVAEWAETIGVSYSYLSRKLRSGWSIPRFLEK